MNHTVKENDYDVPVSRMKLKKRYLICKDGASLQVETEMNGARKMITQKHIGGHNGYK